MEAVGEEQARNMKHDVSLVDRMASIVEALCKAEFQGVMRGGEADAKLQAVLNGRAAFRFSVFPRILFCVVHLP